MDMPSKKVPSSMSTPTCTAEERAWLLVYSKRIYKKTLSTAFRDQFPSGRKDRNVLYHAYNVNSCDAAVKSQLLDLAKTMPWYVSLESKVPLLGLVMSLERVWEAFTLQKCFKARHTSSRARLTSKSKLGMKSRHGRDKRVIK